MYVYAICSLLGDKLGSNEIKTCVLFRRTDERMDGSRVCVPGEWWRDCPSDSSSQSQRLSEQS